MVKVCPLVVKVVGPVIEEPGGRIKVTGFPSAPVRVTTFDVEAEPAPGVDDALEVGLTVKFFPFVVTVVGPAIDTPDDSVKLTGFPSRLVVVTTFDVEAEPAPGVDDALEPGLTVKFFPFIATVVGPVIDTPDGSVKLTGFPSLPVIVTTFDVEAEVASCVDDALRVRLTFNVCSMVVTVVGPVIETPGGNFNETGVPDGPLSVTVLDRKEVGDTVTFPVTVLGADVFSGTDVAVADEFC